MAGTRIDGFLCVGWFEQESFRCTMMYMMSNSSTKVSDGFSNQRCGCTSCSRFSVFIIQATRARTWICLYTVGGRPKYTKHFPCRNTRSGGLCIGKEQTEQTQEVVHSSRTCIPGASRKVFIVRTTYIYIYIYPIELYYIIWYCLILNYIILSYIIS